MSDYKKMMGYKNTKKVKNNDPKINKVLESIKNEFNLTEDSLGDAFHKKIDAYKRKIEKEKEAYRKARERQKEKNEGKLDEGPSYEYRKHINNIKKSSNLHNKSILDFYETLRKKGLNKEAVALLDAYKKNLVGFKKTYDSILRKLL